MNSSLRRLVPPLSALLLLIAGGGLAHAQEARFGDSTWVAPYPIATDPGDPTADGPRTARKDREPTGESVLRFPFRAATYPIRLTARGLERLAGIAFPDIQAPPIRIGFYTEVAKLTPTIYYSSDGGLEPGFQIRRRSFRFDIPNVHINGGWSLRGRRDASAGVVAGPDTARWGAGVEARYRIIPNYRFYGLGNDADETDRSIYRDERGELSMFMRVGLDPVRQVRFLAGYSSISSSGGSRGSPALQDVFDPTTIPFFGKDSQVIWWGAGGDWAVLNHWREPAYGFHARGDIRYFHSTDATGVKYVEVRGEGRGYVPVLATRRVLALRFLFDEVNPDRGSAPIPFYRLPTTYGPYRLAAYHGNQFRDRALAIAQAEYRWMITRGLQAIAIAELGEVAPSSSALRMNDVHESYGGGFRYPLPSGKSLRATLAKGSEGLLLNLVFGSDF